MRRLALRIGLALTIFAIVVGVSAGGLLYIMHRRFNAAPPNPLFARPANELEAQRQDISYFRSLISLDRSYSAGARMQAERRLTTLASRATPLDRPHFRVALMQILALADNGHTHLETGADASSRKLPLRVALFSDGLYVMRATDAASALLGGRIVAIDGKPIAVVMARLAQLRGGTAAWRRLHAVSYLVDQDILFGTDIATAMNQSAWTVAATEGGETSVVLVAGPPRDDEMFAFENRWVSSEPAEGSGEPVSDSSTHWLAEKPDQPLPVTLREFDTGFRRIRVAGSCAMLIQLKSNSDVGTQHIKDFVAATETDMRTAEPCAAILDLRYDDGGDYTNTVGFAKELPNLVAPPGHIYLLTGPATFSAGITTAAFVKQAGGQRVTILGEPVGDRLSFFSEGNRGCLPNYHLCVHYTRGKHDYAHACTDWDSCFWLNRFYPVRVSTLDPDETITMSVAEWRQGHDPVFERALALSRRH